MKSLLTLTLSLILAVAILNDQAIAQAPQPHPGLVIRAYIFEDTAMDLTLVPGTEHKEESELIYPPTRVTRVIQTQLKIIGRGLKNRKGEALAFACIGAQHLEQALTPSCDFLRALYYNPRTGDTYAFGRIYEPKTQNFKQFFESLKDSWQQEGYSKVTVNYFLDFYSDELNNQNDWNWSTRPVQVPYSRFLSITEDIESGYLMHRSPAHPSIYDQMIQPTHPSIFSRWNQSSFK